MDLKQARNSTMNRLHPNFNITQYEELGGKLSQDMRAAVFLLSSWCLQLSCCCPLAALANPCALLWTGPDLVALHRLHLRSFWLTLDNSPKSLAVDAINKDHVDGAFAAAVGAAGLVPGEVRSFAFCCVKRFGTRTYRYSIQSTSAGAASGPSTWG